MSDSIAKCQLCHRNAEIKDLTTTVLLVGGVEETGYVHQRCLDRDPSDKQTFAQWRAGTGY